MAELGTAKTTNFMLSTAEVRIGTQANMWDLSNDDSIGLVKNFTLGADVTFTDLGQGVQNKPVYSTATGVVVSASMEVYEYTASNLALGLGLASGGTYTNVATTADALVTGDDIVVTISIVSETGINVGDYVLIDTDKGVIARTVASTAVGTMDVDQAIPAGVSIASGAAVTKVSNLDVGNPTNEYYSMKAVGKLADGTDVVVLLPKVRILRGFNLSFGTQDYGNMPFETGIYNLVNSDPNFAEFGDAPAKILI